MRGVAGGDHGSSSGPTERVQRGRVVQCSIASCSANAARIASSAVPVRTGGSAIAPPTSSRCCAAQSANPRRRVQSILSRPVLTSTAVASSASVGLELPGTAPIDKRVPEAVRSRSSMEIVGSLVPSSMRETVEVGTPALNASERRDNPACVRASRTRPAAVDIGVAYMQLLVRTSSSGDKAPGSLNVELRLRVVTKRRAVPSIGLHRQSSTKGNAQCTNA